MTKTNYRIQQDIILREKFEKQKNELPFFVEDYFVSVESSTTPLTRLNYLTDLNIFFDYLAGRVFIKDKKKITTQDLDTLKTKDIERYLSFLSGFEKNGEIRTNSDTAKARKLSAVRAFFKYLYANDLLSSNVASLVKTPKIRAKEIVRLETDEVAKIINLAENPDLLTKQQQGFNKHTKKRDVAMLSLMLGTGIRVSECVGINNEDVDFKNNAFTITRKGGSRVVLYFSDEIKNALLTYLEEKENNKAIDPNENALFLSLQNKRITVRAVENMVKKYAKIVSPLKKISPHKLRSTYGTNLYRETKDIYIVADVLGHKDVNTTKKHYAAISEDIRRDVANVVKLR